MHSGQAFSKVAHQAHAHTPAAADLTPWLVHRLFARAGTHHLKSAVYGQQSVVRLYTDFWFKLLVG